MTEPREDMTLAAPDPPPPAPAPTTSRRRRRPRGTFLGLGAVVVFNTVHSLLRDQGYLDGLPVSVVVLLSATAIVCGGLLDLFMGRWFVADGDDEPGGGSRGPGGHNLPFRIANFIGYDSEQDWMRAEFQRFPRGGWRARLPWPRRGEPRTAPLVFLIWGGPGTGKSQLAIRVAHQFADRFPDGVRWVDLYGDRTEYAERELEPAAADTSPGGIRRGGTLARLFRRAPAGGSGVVTSAPRTADSVLTELIDWLGGSSREPRGRLDSAWRSLTSDKRLLLVLENAEDPEKLAKLLPSHPMSAVIITSRRAFDTEAFDFTPIELTGLPPKQGLRLLEQLAPITGTRAEQTRLRALYRQVIERCDDLPLAIGLCGRLLAPPPAPGMSVPRTTHTGRPEELLRRLRDGRHNPLLSGRGFPSSFTVTFQNCGPRRRLLLRRAAMTNLREISEPAAAALLGCPQREAQRITDDLHLRFLLENVGYAADGAPRYRIPQLVRDTLRTRDARDFALDRREARTWEPGADRAARARLVAAYTWLAERAAADLARRDRDFPGPHLQQLPDIDALALTEPTDAHAWLDQERGALLDCVDMATADGHALLGWRIARAVCAMCQVLRTNWEEWEAAAEAQHRLAGHCPDPRHATAMALLDKSELAGGTGDYQLGARYAAEAHGLFGALRSDPRWLARAQRARGANLYRRGDLDTAQAALEEAEAVFRAADEPWWLARTQVNRADLYDRRGHHERAQHLLAEAEHTFRAVDDPEQLHLARLLRAEVLAHRGRPLHAWYLLRDLRDTFRAEENRMRYAWHLARCLTALGSLDGARLTSQYEEAHLELHPERGPERRDRVDSEYIRLTRASGPPEAGATDPAQAEARRHEVRQALREARQERIHDWLGEYETRFRTELTRRPVGWRRAERPLSREWSARERLAMLRRAIHLFEGMGAVWDVHHTQLTLGEVLLRERAYEEGEHVLTEAASGFDRLGNAWWTARTHRLIADAMLGVLHRNHRRAPENGDAAREVHDVRAVTPWERQLAEDAHIHARRAWTAYQDMKNVRGQIRAEVLLARVRRADGSAPVDEIHGWLRAAEDRARELGHGDLVREAERWRAALPVDSVGLGEGDWDL